MSLEHDRIEVRYTATLLTPDPECDTPEECTCTNVYGEWSEHGNGETMVTGWWSPNWSLFEVFEDRPDTPTDVVDLGDPYDRETLEEDYDGDLDAMLRDLVEDRLGAIDHHDGTTYYGADTVDNYRTGERLTPAAHVERSRYHVTPGQMQLLEVTQ